MVHGRYCSGDIIDSIHCRARFFVPGYSSYRPVAVHPILHIVLVQFIQFFNRPCAKQQRRPLPSLLSLTLFYATCCTCCSVSSLMRTIQVVKRLRGEGATLVRCMFRISLAKPNFHSVNKNRQGSRESC